MIMYVINIMGLYIVSYPLKTWPARDLACNRPWLGPAMAVNTMATTMAPASHKSPRGSPPGDLGVHGIFEGLTWFDGISREISEDVFFFAFNMV